MDYRHQLKTAYPKATAPTDKNLAALNAIKGIIKALEKEFISQSCNGQEASYFENGFACPYVSNSYVAPYYLPSSTLNRKSERRRKKKFFQTKFNRHNGLQDIPDYISKPLKQRKDTGPCPFTRFSNDSANFSKNCIEKHVEFLEQNILELQKKEDISKKIENEMPRREEDPIISTKNSNHINFLPPGIKLCPDCCKALANGKLPPPTFFGIKTHKTDCDE